MLDSIIDDPDIFLTGEIGKPELVILVSRLESELQMLKGNIKDPSGHFYTWKLPGCLCRCGLVTQRCEWHGNLPPEFYGVTRYE
jgi:hypothetical protein